jgi:hypothetical protein
MRVTSRLSASLFSSLLFAIPASLSAQRPNDARLLSTISPAALGQPVGISVGLSTLNTDGNLGVADIAIGPGALRLIGAHPSRFESYGLGYAAPVGTRRLARFMSTTLGGELSLGYFGTRNPKSSFVVGNATSLNAHLALPLSFRFGVADYLSFTPYVAPYAEVGSAPTGYWTPMFCNVGTTCESFIYSNHYRTTAMGTALGMRLTAWRFGLDAAYGDMPRYAAHGQSTTVALSLRF